MRPSVVVEVRFNEWTANGRLRQPIFLGVRDDKPAGQIRRERESLQEDAMKHRRAASKKDKSGKRATERRKSASGNADVIRHLDRIERMGGNGSLEFHDGRSLDVTSLDKVFFPNDGCTKGDLMRYYAAVSTAILPEIDGRPLVLRRFPDGIAGVSFFQHSAGDSTPPGVRTALVSVEKAGRQPRFVGGDLPTLLHTVQLGVISVDPWHSRVDSLDEADYSILDLDPVDGAEFADVVHVARMVKRELDEAGLHGALKTSGSRGLHVYLPLPPGTGYDAAIAVAELIARRVVAKDANRTTVTRKVSARPRGSVYVDYQQNVRGKSVAAVFAIRARDGATVSMPISWSSLRRTADPARYTIRSVPSLAPAAARAWTAIMHRPNRLKRLLSKP